MSRLLAEWKVRIYCSDEQWAKLTDDQMDQIADDIESQIEVVEGEIIPGVNVKVES